MLLKKGTIGYKVVKRITDSDYLKNLVYNSFVEDRRYKFNDLSKVKPQNRKARSPILNFYCGTNNIGDLIPSLGIEKMIGQNADIWSILRNFRNQEIDFDFINSNYKCIIIGGAGLFARNLEPFWHQFVQQCKLPSIIWGVGGAGFGDSGYKANKQYIDAVSQASQKCDLVNIRDRYSAELFNIQNASFSACPSIVYLQDYKSLVIQDSNLLLYSSHEPSMSQEEKIRIRNILNQVEPNFIFTDHTQYSFCGLEDILINYYAKSDFVVTTRLHGAIIAYGLGIPYLAINRAKKIEAFFTEYGNGLMIDDLTELESVLNNRVESKIEMKPISIKPILDFGDRAKDWISSIIN
jgi:hypothetical protein